jgi:hypothetical protein
MGINVAGEMLAKLSVQFLAGSRVAKRRSERLVFPFFRFCGNHVYFWLSSIRATVISSLRCLSNGISSTNTDLLLVVRLTSRNVQPFLTGDARSEIAQLDLESGTCGLLSGKASFGKVWNGLAMVANVPVCP